MRTLPFHHALRNAGRRPFRSLLLVLSCGLVAALLVAAGAFVRGLESSLLRAAPPGTAILLSSSAMQDILRSSTSTAVADLVAADVASVLRVGSLPASSPEIHMGTDLGLPGVTGSAQAVVRGVTERAFLVHDSVTVIEGRLPGPGEALVGRLAAAQSGVPAAALAVGATLTVEGGEFAVTGLFAAPGTTLESEIWLPLAELQGLAKRDDCSCVFVRVSSEDDLADVDLFARRRLDLELVSLPASRYYADLAAYFEPILALAWGMAILIGLAATVAGANTVLAMVQERQRELATLRALGYRGSALVWSVSQEVLVLTLTGALLGIGTASTLLSEVSMSMAMSAFQLEVAPSTVLTALLGVLAVAAAGTVPALTRVLRMPVAKALGESTI